jgi:hypothetical protein
MKRAGGLCSNPTCKRSTIGPSVGAPKKSDILGIAAHIKGAQPTSPRYDASQSEEERHSIDNGIWLCSFCATLIDKNGGADYSIEAVKTWKIASERAARERLICSARAVKENCVSTLIYINVPRLIHFDALTQARPTFPHVFEDGIPDDGVIIRELVALNRAIKELEFPAIDWKEAVAAVSDPVGMLVSFEGQFRTKNGPKSREPSNVTDMTNLEMAPHIYTKQMGMKFILPYDPRFLTTNTAVVEFSSGQIRVGGFGLIKRKLTDEIWATPLFIGLWSSPEARAFMNALRSN